MLAVLAAGSAGSAAARRVVAGVQPLAPMANAMTAPLIADVKMAWRPPAGPAAADFAPNCEDMMESLICRWTTGMRALVARLPTSLRQRSGDGGTIEQRGRLIRQALKVFGDAERARLHRRCNRTRIGR